MTLPSQDLQCHHWYRFDYISTSCMDAVIQGWYWYVCRGPFNCQIFLGLNLIFSEETTRSTISLGLVISLLSGSCVMDQGAAGGGSTWFCPPGVSSPPCCICLFSAAFDYINILHGRCYTGLVLIRLFRVEICRDRHNRRSCKICFRCVNCFPENNAISRIICVELQNLHTPSVILHWIC